jgi:ATP:ADP antiporter, AAA family
MNAPGPRQGRASKSTLSAWTAAAMLAQHVAGKALRDGLFLSQYSVAELPKVMLASAVLSAPAVLSVSLAMRRVGPQRIAPLAFGLSASLFALEWALLRTSPLWAAGLVYLHVAAFGGTVISIFWSAIGERFDPYSAKQSIGRVASGATLGGLLGGVFVSQTAHRLDTGSLLLALALVNLGCALSMARSSAAEPPEAQASADSGSALPALARSSYLRTIAYLVVLTGLSSSLLDFSFKSAAAQSFGSGPRLLQFFALFHTASGLFSVLVQTTLSRRALERLGLAGTLALLPASVLLSGTLGLGLPALWSRVLPRASSAVLESSLFRSAYEPLYTPLSAATRRSSKTIIDVAGGRLGEGLGSAAVLLLVSLAVSVDARVMALAMGCALLALWISLRVHAGYVSELAASLRSGSLVLGAADVQDATTRLTLSQTQAELSRGELLAQLANLREQAQHGPARVSLAPAARAALADQNRQAHEALLSAADDLLSAEFARVRRALEQPLDTRLVGLAIPLLQHAELIEPVTSALKAIAPRVQGQLIDALLDPKLSALVRRRLPRVLRVVEDARVAQGLQLALKTPEHEVRYRATLALAQLTAARPELAPEPRAVFSLVRDELKLCGVEPLPLHHVFALLSLALEREALRLARRALVADDARQRGTALEYLQNVLPEPLRSELMSRLQSDLSRPPPSVSPSVLESD